VLIEEPLSARWGLGHSMASGAWATAVTVGTCGASLGQGEHNQGQGGLGQGGQVPPGSTMPLHHLDSTHQGGPVNWPWEIAERERREREEREECERMKRMVRTGIPPPQRDDKRYGPLAQNPDGDAAFRKDRCALYERQGKQPAASDSAPSGP
jgi:hypothetical protein